MPSIAPSPVVSQLPPAAVLTAAVTQAPVAPAVTVQAPPPAVTQVAATTTAATSGGSRDGFATATRTTVSASALPRAVSKWLRDEEVSAYAMRSLSVDGKTFYELISEEDGVASAAIVDDKGTLVAQYDADALYLAFEPSADEQKADDAVRVGLEKLMGSKGLNSAKLKPFAMTDTAALQKATQFEAEEDGEAPRGFKVDVGGQSFYLFDPGTGDESLVLDDQLRTIGTVAWGDGAVDVEVQQVRGGQQMPALPAAPNLPTGGEDGFDDAPVRRAPVSLRGDR